MYTHFYKNYLVAQGYKGASLATGFLPGSAGKESGFNAGDHNLIPCLGTSSGEGIGYPLQYSWMSLVTEMIKNLPAIQETWVPSLS